MRCLITSVPGPAIKIKWFAVIELFKFLIKSITFKVINIQCSCDMSAFKFPGGSHIHQLHLVHMYSFLKIFSVQHFHIGIHS